MTVRLKWDNNLYLKVKYDKNSRVCPWFILINICTNPTWHSLLLGILSCDHIGGLGRGNHNKHFRFPWLYVLIQFFAGMLWENNHNYHVRLLLAYLWPVKSYFCVFSLQNHQGVITNFLCNYHRTDHPQGG